MPKFECVCKCKVEVFAEDEDEALDKAVLCLEEDNTCESTECSCVCEEIG